jgi:antibiotic biosynthesis monooxygenase (ABM) superfamily enzyme
LLKARLAFVFLAWIFAFGIVMALFLLLGDELSAMPLALRALSISGVLVVTMTQVVIPLIRSFLSRIVRE